MYLSKLLLDPVSHQVQREVANRYELHRTLTAQFPQEARQDINLLYRIELPDRQVYQPITLLVQTQIEPVWNALAESGLLTEQPQVKLFDPVIPDGRTFYFRLLGNPTVRRKQPDGSSKRVGLYTIEEQNDWINRKAEQAGFQINAVKSTDQGMIESIKRKNGRTFNIKHLSVQFDGILLVTNPERFQNTLVKGIGSAKAFGFGLLSLAK
jgi:CRISPR system Cascade subunit CasE